MDPITLALGVFSLLATAGVAWAKHSYDSDETTPGTTAYNNKQSLDLAKQNLSLNETASVQNFELAKEQFEYQKELNQTIMDREDTAYQRQVSDLKAAGLSPFMVAGGSSAASLTSAAAPQRDLSGINTAVQNALGAYNDIYNRKLSRQQFALQSKVQTAQAYTQLMEYKLNQKKINQEMNYLDEKLNWEKINGFRNVDLNTILANIVEKYLDKNYSSVLSGDFPKPELPKISLNDFKLDTNTSKPFNFNALFTGSRKVDTSVKSNTETNRKKDIKNLNNLEKNRVDRSVYYLENHPWNKDDNKWYDATEYLYNHSDAWRDYRTLSQFQSAIRNLKVLQRNSFLSKYMYKERNLELGR